jgi:hypothetical protein
MEALGILVAVALSLSPAQEHPEEVEDAPGIWFRHPNVGYGPFHYTSLSLFPSLRPGFETRFPTSLAAKTFDLRFTESWVKNQAVETDWEMKFEVLRSNVALTWQVSEHVVFEVAVDSGHRTGGGLDAVILGFHDAFGIAVGARNQFSRNENRIQIQPPGGGPQILVDETDPQPFEQAILLTFQHILTYGDDVAPAVSWSVTARRHLDEGDLDPQGPVDLGASLGLVKQLGPFHFYLGGTFTWFGREDFFGLKLRTTQWSAIAALEIHVIDDFSVIGQLLVTSGGVDGLQHLSDPSYEVTAGFKWEFWDGMLLDFGIVENIIDFRNSPDFGVHGGLTFRW